MVGLSEKWEQDRTAEVSSASRSKDGKEERRMQSKENIISKVKTINEIRLSESLALYQRLIALYRRTFRSQYQGQQGQIHTVQVLTPMSGRFLHTKTNHNSFLEEKWWVASWDSL